MISIVISLVIISIIYFCLNNYGFKIAWIITAIVLFIESIVEQQVNLGMSYIIGLIVGSCISSLIYCGICNFIYTKTTTFWSYALLSILLAVALYIGFSVLIGAIIFSSM